MATGGGGGMTFMNPSDFERQPSHNAEVFINPGSVIGSNNGGSNHFNLGR